MNMLPDPLLFRLAPIPFDQFRDEVLALYQPPLRAPTTLGKMRQVLGLVEALLGPEATTEALSPELLAAFIASRPAGQSTNSTIGLLGYLRAACSYAEMRGYLRASPFRFRKRWLRPAPPQGKTHHSRVEIGKVLDLLGSEAEQRVGWAGWRAWRLYALVATVAFTGLRKNEALHLQVEDVDLAGGILFIVARVRRLKTVASAQPVPIPDRLAEILAEWLRRRVAVPTASPDAPGPEASPWLFPNVRAVGTPWTGGPTGGKPIDRLKAAGRRAGVEGLTFQSLRHSYATHGESAWGLGPALLQRLLRHTTPMTQHHYRHADLPNLRAAVRSIDFGPAEASGPGDQRP